jgi:hypothetical protein
MTAIHRTPDSQTACSLKQLGNDDRLTEIREVWFSLIEDHVRICRCPDFLHRCTSLEHSGAAFFEESRMQFCGPLKLHRKSEFGLYQSRNRWGRNRGIQRVTARASFFDVAGPESAQTRPGAGLFSWLISPEYTIRDGPIFASNSRASMKIRNQMYAPPTASNHYTIPAKIEAS